MLGTEAANSHNRISHESTIDEIMAQKQRLECQVSALNEDRAVLQEQLQEVSCC